MKFLIFASLVALLLACTHETQINDSEINEESSLEQTTFCIENTVALGDFDGIALQEGGFSGLIYIPGTEYEFFTVTDRGPNMLLEKNKAGIPVMFFPFPDYTQKIIHLKIEANKLKILAIHPILDKNGAPISGLPPRISNDKLTEIPAKNTAGEKPEYLTDWNFDFEGITRDAKGDFWLADEYRPAIVRVDGKTFRIQEVLSAETENLGGTKILDPTFSKRQPNRGFEGIGITPSGKIIAMLQSPIAEYETTDTLKTRLIRILHFDPVNGKSRVFGYEASDNVKDPKIGDLAVINEYEILIIEHGKDNSGKVANIFKLDLEFATNILEFNFGQGTSFEALANNARAQYRGIILAQKTHVLDLIAHGFNSKFGKPEGLSIIDERTIAVGNDNDFGIDGLSDSQKIILNNQPSCVYIYKLTSPVF